MKLCNRHSESRSQGRSAVLSSIVVFVLIGPIPSPAAAQTTHNSQPNSAQRSILVLRVQTGTDRHQDQLNTGNLNSPAVVAPDAQPAAVILKNGTLTIEADNSDLDQILQDVSRESGMVIEGPVKDVRVYGSYGPRNPCEILSELLAGLGYNIIMVGTAREGAPRELMLTSRAGSPPTALPSKAPEKAPEKTEAPELGPGAIAHPPPAPADDPQLRAQQNLQRLQQMHDSQEKENVPR